MPTIYGPREDRTNEPDGVKSVTEVRTYAYKRVIDGRTVTGLALVFGVMKDGGAGVFIMAEGQQLSEQLREAADDLRDRIRREHSAATEGDAAVRLPAGMTSFDPRG